MSKFEASVQYNEMKGSAAVDTADGITLTMWLKEQGDIVEGEYVIGVLMYAGENHGTHRDPVRVTFYVSEKESKYDSVVAMIKAKRVFRPKKVTKKMNIADFLALFKRFEITLSLSGTLEGKRVE